VPPFWVKTPDPGAVASTLSAAIRLVPLIEACSVSARTNSGIGPASVTADFPTDTSTLFMGPSLITFPPSTMV